MKIFDIKHFPRTPHDLVRMNKDGKLSFDNAVQRNLGWNEDQKSLLIHSIIIGFPIPAMYCNCIFENVKTKTYDFLDGKQRTLGAIIPFLNDEYALTNVPIINMDENSDDNEGADPEKLLNINGLKYSQLPEELRDKVRTRSLNIYYYENLNQEEAEEMIRRLNNGKSFTAIELTRIKAKSLDTIKEIGRHSIFNSALTEKAMNKYTNEDIVIKSWIILNNENPSFETKQIRPILESAEITPEQAEIITTVYDKVLEKFIDRLKKIKLGNPMENADVGPLVSKKQLDLLEIQVKDAIEKGAKVEIGGKRPVGKQYKKGNYFEPTILTNVNFDMKVMSEETFGPVLPIIPFETEDEVVEMANRTQYGLTSEIYTTDLEKGEKIGKRLDSGVVAINTDSFYKPVCPIGGYKKSGIGREYGKIGMQEFTQVKLIAVNKP